MTVETPSGRLDLSQYEKLVHRLAWKCARRLPKRSLLEHDDLAQEGWVALARAARTYRPLPLDQVGRSYTPGVKQVGGSFLTYAYVILARRYSEILHREHARVVFDRPLLFAGAPVEGEGDEWAMDTDALLEDLAPSPPPQTLVETRLDLARGYWAGPRALTPRQAEEARERLAVLV